jgi:hypothetical protein
MAAGNPEIITPEYPFGRYQVFWWGFDWHLLGRPVGFFRFTSINMRVIFRWQLWIGPLTVRRWESTSRALAILEERHKQTVD